MKRTVSLWIILSALALGCSDTKPKVLGKNLVDFESGDSSSDAFRFNFSYRNNAASAPHDRIIYIQGAKDTRTALISVCNAAGTSCVCDFYDANDAKISETSSTEISYDSTGNYFRCKYNGSIPSLAKVRIRTQNSSRLGPTLSVEDNTTMTAAKLIGSELDANFIRTVYRYECQHNYLEKNGTSSTSFDCSSQGNLCGNAGTGDFCLLKSNFPFWLFTDNYTTNFPLKGSDLLYGAESGTDRICGIQIKQFDCAGATGSPLKQFGVYGQQIGVFDTPIALNSAPRASATNFGFVAKTSTFDGNTVCPPAMELRVFYEATTSLASIGGQSSNYPDNQKISNIDIPASTTLSPINVDRVKGGDCSGTACTLPTAADGTATSFSYSALGTQFCVIPASLLL
jgi:hypothetical protein